MSRRVKITCKYYWVKKYSEIGNGKDEELFDLLEWLEKIKDMDLSQKVKPIGTEKGRLDICKSRDDYFALNFIKMEEYSSMYIVGHEKNARHVDISVENDEYIGKNTVALYDSKRAIMMVMSNRGGFSPNTITSYINSFYDEPVCVLEPIKENKNYYNPHSKYGKITIKISSVNDFISSKGAPYEEALRAAAQMDSETFSFEFNVGRKKNKYLDADVVRTIISDAFNNMGAVSIAQVRMTDEEGTALYNLFENVMCSTLSMKSDEKGEIAFEEIASNMIEEYSKTKYAKQG